jgi:hypothetical protein
MHMPWTPLAHPFPPSFPVLLLHANPQRAKAVVPAPDPVIQPPTPPLEMDVRRWQGPIIAMATRNGEWVTWGVTGVTWGVTGVTRQVMCHVMGGKCSTANVAIHVRVRGSPLAPACASLLVMPLIPNPLDYPSTEVPLPFPFLHPNTKHMSPPPPRAVALSTCS